MHFIRSEFRGLLPGRFSKESVSNVVENFNDQNKEELDKYVSYIFMIIILLLCVVCYMLIKLFIYPKYILVPSCKWLKSLKKNCVL